MNVKAFLILSSILYRLLVSLGSKIIIVLPILRLIIDYIKVASNVQPYGMALSYLDLKKLRASTQQNLLRHTFLLN